MNVPVLLVTLTPAFVLALIGFLPSPDRWDDQ